MLSSRRIVSDEAPAIPPPLLAELPATVLATKVRAMPPLSRAMPPPTLPLMVLLITSRLPPASAMPPPEPTNVEFLVTTTFTNRVVSRPGRPLLNNPAPVGPTLPRKVKPERVTPSAVPVIVTNDAGADRPVPPMTVWLEPDPASVSDLLIVTVSV